MMCAVNSRAALAMSVLRMAAVSIASAHAMYVGTATTGANDGSGRTGGGFCTSPVGLDALGYSWPSQQLNCQETTKSQA